MRFFGFMWLIENICHKMALESGNGRSSGICPLTSNSHHLHSRRCCPHLISFCDVSKKCYRWVGCLCSGKIKLPRPVIKQSLVFTHSARCCIILWGHDPGHALNALPSYRNNLGFLPIWVYIGDFRPKKCKEKIVTRVGISGTCCVSDTFSAAIKQ
jgi:hypothetical protein